MKNTASRQFKYGLVLAILVAGVGVSCGKKGPLYLPKSAVQTQPKAVNKTAEVKPEAENKIKQSTLTAQ